MWAFLEPTALWGSCCGWAPSPTNSPCLRLNSPPAYNPGPQWGYTQMESCASSLPPGLPSTAHGLFSLKPCHPPPHCRASTRGSPRATTRPRITLTGSPGLHSLFLLGPRLRPDSSTLLAQVQTSSQEAESDLIIRPRTKSSPSPGPASPPPLDPHVARLFVP